MILIDEGSRAGTRYCLIVCLDAGRIVNVSSVRGRMYAPFNATYGSTKFAMETFSDVLRVEMSRWGVKVVLVEPGHFGGATGMMNVRLFALHYITGLSERFQKWGWGEHTKWRCSTFFT